MTYARTQVILEIFFALIFSGLRGCFSKNGVFAYKMNFVENFFFGRQKGRAEFCPKI
jgi:hypothetical protein